MFIGGQGIILASLSILTRARSVALGFYIGEARQEKILPNVIATARFIWKVSFVYLILGVITFFTIRSFRIRSYEVIRFPFFFILSFRKDRKRSIVALNFFQTFPRNILKIFFVSIIFFRKLKIFFAYKLITSLFLKEEGR